MSGSQHDLLIYTLHRFAVTAAGQRLVFDKRALTDILSEAMIETFRDLIDLDDAQRKELGQKVLEKMNLKRPSWIARKNPSIGRTRPSMR